MGLGAYCEIQMADLTVKRAENLDAGDQIREASTGAAAEVVKVHNGPAVGMFRVSGDNGRGVDLTADHQILTVNGLVDAGRVKPGDLLSTAFGPVRCAESGPLPGDFMVYDPVVRAAAPCLTVNGFVIAALAAR